MATITKTASGTWKALVRRQGWPAEIKTHRLKRDAEDWARRTEDELVRGVYIRRGPSEKLSCADALVRYKDEVVPTKKPSTQLREGARIAQLTAFFGDYSLATITPDLVAKFRDKRLGEGKANNTVRLELAMLGHLFNVAIKEWQIGLVYNPVASIRKPSPGRARERRLDPEEATALMARVATHSNPMLAWIVSIAVETVMRLSEITTLTVSQVDLKRRMVRLHDTKNGDSRTVPLSKTATSAFEAALNNPLRPEGIELVFFGEPGNGGIRRPYEFGKSWRRILEGLNIRDFRFHDLRHEGVSKLVEAGLSDQEVASISGHKSMQMLRRYTHLRTEDLVAKLDRLSIPDL